MKTPKTYIGYDSQGNRVGSCTAVDANEYINPSEVQAAIDNVEIVATEQMGLIVSALNSITDDASEAVIVQGTKMTSTIEEVVEALGKIPESITDSISSLYTEAVSVHDQLQTTANDNAYNSMRNTAGVTSVSE